MAREIHIIHDTYGGRERREWVRNGALVTTIGIVLIIAAVGGAMSKDYKFAFWGFIVGLALIFLGYKMAMKGKKPKEGIRVRFD